MQTGIQIAFLGGGNMARALIAGLIRAGHDRARLRVGEPIEAQRATLAAGFGIETSADNATAVAGADLVVLAVKPQESIAVLRALPSPPRLLLSIAAGIRVEQLQAASPGTHVVRAMPNRPALVGAGMTGAYCAAEVTAAERSHAATVLGSAGELVWLHEEAELDLVTALSGSGPAYFFLLAEELAAAGVRAGLSPAIAARLAAGTLQGAGALIGAAVAAGGSPAEVLPAERTAVTSKGGTTEAALRVMVEQGLGNLVDQAFRAAAHRSVELAALLAR
jgi:pyrroline-5-carboxylate reductase